MPTQPIPSPSAEAPAFAQTSSSPATSSSSTEATASASAPLASPVSAFPPPDLTALLFSVLCRCLALDEDSEEASATILPAYLSPEPPPQPPRSRTVVYYYLVPEDDETARFQTLSFEAGRPAVSAFLPFSLILICYGPAAETAAHWIRSNLFLDGASRPLSLLRRAGVFPLPSPSLPAVSWEEDGKLWRKRADLTISLRLASTLIYPSAQPMLSVPPPVHFL